MWTTKDGFDVWLHSVLLERTWSGLMEARPSTVPASHALGFAAQRAKQVLFCQAFVVHDHPALLPRWQWLLHFRASRAAHISDVDHASELVMAVYTEETAQSVETLALRVVPNVVWREHAADYDVARF